MRPRGGRVQSGRDEARLHQLCDGVRVWALDIDELLEIARREAGRSLTDEECRQYLHVDECSQA